MPAVAGGWSAFAATLLLGCGARGVVLPTPSAPRLDPGLSAQVAAEVRGYPTDGSYGFYWPPDDGVWWGTTRDVWYLGALVSPGDPGHRSHCVGLTWEVAMAVLQAEAGAEAAINGMTAADLVAFRTDWFVRDIGGVGAAEALERAGVGGRVPLAEARPGDFLQMWSAGGAGHSGVFDGWETRGARVTGVRYWSTHPALGGIGLWTDAVGDRGIDVDRLYVGRVARRDRWVPPRFTPEG